MCELTLILKSKTLHWDVWKPRKLKPFEKHVKKTPENFEDLSCLTDRNALHMCVLEREGLKEKKNTTNTFFFMLSKIQLLILEVVYIRIVNNKLFMPNFLKLWRNLWKEFRWMMIFLGHEENMR